MTVYRGFTHTIRLVCISLLFSAANAFGFTTYFLSSAGSDANDGRTTLTPWKTIAKVNATALVSGDVVSLRSGDTFYGQLTMNQSGLTYESYGSGAKPVITGGIQLTGWTVYSGSIYAVQAGAFVKDLFANGVQMTVARYPNTGLVTVSSTNGSSTVASAGITQASGYWTGGTIHIRTTDWTYESRPIASYNGSTLTLTGAPEFAYGAGWGFYLDGKLAALDAPGEWYCDPSTNTVYFYAPGGVNPSTLTVTGSVIDYGIAGTQGGGTIRNLAFTYQAAAAIRFSGSASNVAIRSNDIFGQWMHGIDFVGSHANCTIDGNTFQNINGRGINAWGPQSFTITNNAFRSIGLVPGYGSSGFTGLTAVLAQAGARNTISFNTIDSVGYIGIRHDGSYNLIEKNVITNTMLKLCDGGAIYAWGGTGGTFGTVIRNNIIENVPGDASGVAHQPSVKQGHGIYFDLGCFNMVMEGNTIIHAGDAGVFIQYSDYGITVRNNMFYECAANYYSAAVDLQQNNSMGHGQNVFAGNVFFPLNNSQPHVRQQQAVSLSALQSIGRADSNYYCDPYNRNAQFHIVYNGGSWDTYVATLAQWRSTTGQDAHSKDMYTKLAANDTRRSLFVNRTSSASTLSLSGVGYRDLDGVAVTGTITLQPFSSRLLIKDTTATGTPGGGQDVVLISPTLGNGGFETAGAGGADVAGAWTEEKSAGTGTIALDAANARTGAGALRLTTDAGATMLVYQPALTVGQVYRVDLYAKRLSGSPVVTVGGWYAKATCVPTASYAAYSLTFTAADTYLRVYNDIGSSSVVIDDLTLTAVNSSNPLPVELVSFTAALKSGSVVLNWKTATEVNNYGFEIEKKPLGGPQAGVWATLGFVAGNGTSNAPHEYTFTDQAVQTVSSAYRLKQVDRDGQFVYSREIEIQLATDVSSAAMPREFSLDQNYPNPFNPSTTLQYAVAEAGPVRLTVFDVTGREVASLVNGRMEAGRYSVQWNAGDLPSGVYFCRLTAGSFTGVKKLLLQK